MDKLEQLRQWINESERIVFFGGAGVSTESGIPDFRSVDGLYNQKYKYPPETILSRTFYCSHLADFYEFYRDKLLNLDAKPNKAHYALAKLEETGKLTAVVTQNIDGLHQAAGSKTVYELHGSVHRNYCLRCGKMHPAEYIKSVDGPPPCLDCGGLKARRCAVRGGSEHRNGAGSNKGYYGSGYAYHRGHVPVGLPCKRAY